MYQKIIGPWPKHDKFLLTSCDEVYLNRYFPRFYKTFSEHWQLPIHVHVIDPSETSKARLQKLPVSFTYCDTTSHDWVSEVKKYKKHESVQQDNSVVRQWLYETYCQCQRFIILGAYMANNQNIVVADVDAYAQRVPNRRSRKELFRQTAFSRHGGRIMATFCHLHPNDLSKIRNVAEDIVHTANNDHFQIGLDQKALAKVFNQEVWTNLDKNWIRHFDVKDETDRHHHSLCYIYHEKGLRGKDFDVKWTSW